MITIKFPKAPRTSPRKKIQSIGQKYDYSEDDYYSIIKIPEINGDLYEIFNIIGHWQNCFCFIDEFEIDISHLNNILYCISNKIPSTNLRWYGMQRFAFREDDLVEIKNKINQITINNRGFSYEFEILSELKLISVIKYKKEYNVEKESFKAKVTDKILIIKKLIPDFDDKEVISIIDSFPEKIIIPDKKEPAKPEGEEWVDWYNPMKCNIEILKVLRKIEENTRK